MTKKETNLSGTLSEAVSVATSVAYTRQEIQKLKTELVSLLEKKTTELIVEQVPGPVGPRGALGATGAQGAKGDKGDRGDVGERGEKGEVGPQGNMGLDGPRGLKGDKGDKGEQGQVGPQGEQGIQGVAGERGEKGDKGDRGADGKNGLDGRDGETGAVGPAGPIGETGLQGEQGLKGDKGERGRDGQQGIAGPAGPQGEVGPQGVQGVPGKDGKDGDIKPVEEKFQKFIDNVQRDVSAFKTKVNAAILKSGPNDAWKATGSGEVNLRYLDDIDRDSITDGYVLSYDSANAKFTFVEQGGGDGTDQWARDQANAAYNYANTLALESGTLDTTARTRANSAWYTANLAYVTANSAWATANSALNQQSGDLDLFARSQANSAFSQANLSYTVANNSWSTANASYIQANTALDLANSAFAKANTGGAAGTDNLARSIANSAFSTANTKSYTFSQNTAPVTANTNDFWANIDSGVVYYNFGNTSSPVWVEFGPTSSGGTSNLVGYAVNTTVDIIWSNSNSAFAQANTANSIAQAAYNYANTIVSDIQIDPWARSQSNSAFNQANTATTNAATANTKAQAAYDYANTIVIPSLSGYAVNTTVNTIWSNSNSAFSTANASYNQANTATTNASNADVKAQAAYDYANTIVVPSLSGYATNTTVNLVWSTANNAYAQANSALSIAQSAFAQANTGGAAGTDNVARSIANSAFSTANTANANAQAAYDYANTIVVPSLTGYATTATTNAISNTLSTVWATANNSYAQANTANTKAQAAYDKANTVPSAVTSQNYVYVIANTAGTLKTWEFSPSGSINFPDSTSQTTAFTGTAIDSLARTTANSATTLAQAAYNQANTGAATSQLINGSSIVSLSNNDILTVPGPISGLGNSKLDFTTYGSNTAYLTTTSDDSTALYMSLQAAELYAYTNVQIRANTAGMSQNWTFGADGTLTFPDNTTQTTAFTGGGAITYQPVSTTGYGLTISSANTQGGTGYADFLKVTNSSTGATNPNKSFRLDNAGSFQIINSAYTANLFELSDSGNLNLPSGTLRVGGKQTVNGPAFSVYRDSVATIPTDVLTLMAWTTEEYDTAGCMTSTRFTPNVAGYYSLVGSVRIDGDIGTGERMISIKKNGNEYRRGMNAKGTASVGTEWFQMEVSCQVYANGTTDYFELFVQHGAGTNRNTTAGQPFTAFQGCMIRGA